MVLALFCLFIVLLARFITNKVPFASPDYQFDNAKKSSIQGLAVIAAVIILSIVCILYMSKFVKNTSELGIMLMQSLFYILLTGIVILTVMLNKEGLQSIGIMKLNLMKSCFLGIVLGIIFFVVRQYSSKTDDPAVNIISIAGLVSFVKFLIVGFAEEIIYRGYLQTRLIAWQGTLKGCLLTAFIFSFWHLPHNLILDGMNLQDAFLNCVNLISASLMLGYIMIRTKNITSVAILHTFINWTVN